jgi:hypothetical protein
MSKKVNQRHKDGEKILVTGHYIVFILFTLCMKWPHSGEVRFVCLIIHKFNLCDCYLDFKIFAVWSLH